MSLRFDTYVGPGLPEDFYDGVLYQGHEESPGDLAVGTIVTDRAQDVSYILLQADGAIPGRALVQRDITIVTNTSALTGGAAKGTKGDRIVSIIQAGVSADQYAGGSLRPLTMPQYIYQIQSNTASSTSAPTNLVELTLTTPLLATIANSGGVRLRSPMKAVVTDPNTPDIVLAMTLEAIKDEEYFFGQQTGDADIVSSPIASGDLDNALTKDTAGRVKAAGEGDQLVAYHAENQPNAITGTTTILPVRLVLGNGWA